MGDRRPYVSKDTKLAAALLQLRDEQGVLLIPYEHAKLMSDEQIISLFQFDHNIRHIDGGPAEPWNLAPMLIAGHRRKTATKDVPEIRKRVRIVADEAEFRRRMLAKDAGEPRPAPAKAKRKIQGRPLRSGNNLRRSR